MNTNFYHHFELFKIFVIWLSGNPDCDSDFKTRILSSFDLNRFTNEELTSHVRKSKLYSVEDILDALSKKNILLSESNKELRKKISIVNEFAGSEIMRMQKDFKITNLEIKASIEEKRISMDKKIDDVKTLYETQIDNLMRNFDKEKVEMKKSFDKEKNELKKNCEKEKDELKKIFDKEKSDLKKNFYKEKNDLKKNFEKEKKVLSKKQND